MLEDGASRSHSLARFSSPGLGKVGMKDLLMEALSEWIFLKAARQAAVISWGVYEGEGTRPRASKMSKGSLKPGMTRARAIVEVRIGTFLN